MLDTRKMLSDINAEMGRLGKIRDLLQMENGATPPAVPQPMKMPIASSAPAKAPVKRNLTPEGRERIVAAIKKRWADKKKQGKSMSGQPLKKAPAKKAAKKAPAKKAVGRPKNVPDSTATPAT